MCVGLRNLVIFSEFDHYLSIKHCIESDLSVVFQLLKISIRQCGISFGEVESVNDFANHEAMKVTLTFKNTQQENFSFDVDAVAHLCKPFDEL